MDIIELLKSLKEKLEQAELLIEEVSKKKYDEGFAAGVASVQVGSDKIYSQAELDEKLKPLQDKVLELEGSVVELKAKIDAFPQVLEEAKVKAVADFKADIAAKYAELQVVESQAETGFAELLK